MTNTQAWTDVTNETELDLEFYTNDTKTKRNTSIHQYFNTKNPLHTKGIMLFKPDHMPAYRNLLKFSEVHDDMSEGLIAWVAQIGLSLDKKYNYNWRLGDTYDIKLTKRSFGMLETEVTDGGSVSAEYIKEIQDVLEDIKKVTVRMKAK